MNKAEAVSRSPTQRISLPIDVRKAKPASCSLGLNTPSMRRKNRPIFPMKARASQRPCHLLTLRRHRRGSNVGSAASPAVCGRPGDTPRRCPRRPRNGLDFTDNEKTLPVSAAESPRGSKCDVRVLGRAVRVNLDGSAPSPWGPLLKEGPAGARDRRTGRRDARGTASRRQKLLPGKS